MNMPLRRGVHRDLEDAADAMIKESLKSVTRHSDKSDILTPWKEQERRRREIYVPSGTPDASNRQGIFHRTINTGSPHLNSRNSSTSRGSRVGAARLVNEAEWDFGNDPMRTNVAPTVSWDDE